MVIFSGLLFIQIPLIVAQSPWSSMSPSCARNVRMCLNQRVREDLINLSFRAQQAHVVGGEEKVSEQRYHRRFYKATSLRRQVLQRFVWKGRTILLVPEV